MTTKPTAPDAAAPAPVKQFPELPPRDDMNNPLYLHDPGHQPALRRHLGNPTTTIVISEIPVGWRYNQPQGLLKSDLLVAFDIDRAAIVAQAGYSILDWGKPPDFVLEIASKSTSERDETAKRAGYAEYGVPEYWRFDPTEAELYEARLAGDRLVDGEYRPIPVVPVGEAMYRGYSPALNLYLCWERRQMRWYDPVARRYLRTHDDEAEDRIVAETALAISEAARSTAEAERDAEREARLRLDAEIRRLQNS